MPRPLSQGVHAIAGDIVALNRALLRAQTDVKKTPREVEALCMHLREAIAILVRQQRAASPVRKVG